MLHIALYEPEIPPNTGNIIRLCANSGCQLHLIHPLGFALDDKRMRRAGLDYHEFAHVKEHVDFASFASAMQGHRIIACETQGSVHHSRFAYTDGDVLLFGPETRGLPKEIIEQPDIACVRIPMQANSRSLNLSNASAIILYEALRQLDYPGLN